jgi:hypothetical protein
MGFLRLCLYLCLCACVCACLCVFEGVAEAYIAYMDEHGRMG